MYWGSKYNGNSPDNGFILLEDNAHIKGNQINSIEGCLIKTIGI